MFGPRRRDEEFTRFVQERSPRLRLVARAVCGDRALADDLVQEALERTYVTWPRLRDDDPIGYARRTLVNLAIDRSRRRRVTEVGVEVDPGRVDSRLDQVLDQAELDALLAGLTERERAVVTLRYLEDLSEADTAAVLGVAVGTVKSATSRALARLRDLHAAQAAPSDATTRSIHV